MADIGDEDNSAGGSRADDTEAATEEFASILSAGPQSGNRSGGLSLLAVLVILAAILAYYFSGSSSESFISRLDAELLANAELSIASSQEGGTMVIVPSWPLRMYITLRNDILFFTAAASLAAMLWSLSSRARAKRDTYLLHNETKKEMDRLRQRVAHLEHEAGIQPESTEVVSTKVNQERE